MLLRFLVLVVRDSVITLSEIAYNLNNNLDEVLLVIVCTVYSGNIVTRSRLVLKVAVTRALVALGSSVLVQRQAGLHAEGRWRLVSRIISYILRFRIKFCFVKKRFGFYFDQSERRNEFLTREKIVSSNHKPQFKRIVFSRAFSRSSRVALSGSFDKILYFRCTRVVRNSNFQVIKS